MFDFLFRLNSLPFFLNVPYINIHISFIASDLSFILLDLHVDLFHWVLFPHGSIIFFFFSLSTYSPFL